MRGAWLSSHVKKCPFRIFRFEIQAMYCRKTRDQLAKYHVASKVEGETVLKSTKQAMTMAMTMVMAMTMTMAMMIAT